MPSTSLAFHATQFDVVERNSQPWLKAADIARALGYSRSDQVSRLYRSNSGEFTDAMTAVIPGNTDSVFSGEARIFSLRGAHLLAMFARTKTAAEFRRWVLDVLDREVAAQPKPGITPAQQQTLKACVHLVTVGTGLSHQEVWSRFHARFEVARYDQLDPARFGEAVDYLKAEVQHDGAAMAQLAGAMFLRGRRFLLAFDYQGQPVLEPIHPHAELVFPGDVPGLISSGWIDKGTLPALINRAVSRLSQ